jgi:dolichyl-phosphate-mannose-protein mannosyltransferase
MARTKQTGLSTPGKTSRSPSAQRVATLPKKTGDYTSEGVEDQDVFLLPANDYTIMGVVTLLAAVVRLFRIYQPSSVVFDEVQYVSCPFLRT